MAILLEEVTAGLRAAVEGRDVESITNFAILLTTRFALREETMSVSDGATKGELNVLSDRLSELIGVVREGFAQMERRFEDMNRRFDDVNKRFDDVNKRFDDVNARFEDVNRRFVDVNSRFDDVNQRFTQMMWLIGILFGSLHVVLAIYGLL